MSASITYWNRLEPRARTATLDRALAAQVRDPLWMLTRQWQFGEFRGEDAATIAFATVARTTTAFTAWSPTGGPSTATGEGPLDPVALSEAIEPDHAIAVDLAGLLDELAAEAGILGIASALLATGYAMGGPNAAAPATDADLAAQADRDAQRFLGVVSQRCVDGVAVLNAATADAGALASSLGLDPGQSSAAEAIFREFVAEAAATFGTLGTADPRTWVAERLRSSLSVEAPDPSGGGITMAVEPDDRGSISWYSLDVATTAEGVATGETSQASVLPLPVLFRGMPRPRWWQFEDGRMDVGGIQPDRRDLATLLVMDFLLVHGNDWFVIPSPQTVGTIDRVDTLMIRDVFGGTSVVEPIGSATGWTVFRPTGTVQAWHLLPPSFGPGGLRSEPIESVHFIRDESANIAWGVEAQLSSGAGASLPGPERSAALRSLYASSTTGDTSTGGLTYRVGGTVPDHWIPLLPVVAGSGSAEVALERGAMVRVRDDGSEGEVAPIGRILNPPALPYRIREEEIPGEGLRVERTIRYARWWDGSSHLWVARAREIGAHERNAGLQYDRATTET